jgi:hypothetical protein
MNNYPLDECAAKAERLVAAGAQVYQKFTCSSCGSRQTIDTPNVFYTTGRCEECGHITNIKADGCNYLVHAGPGTQEAVFKELLTK